MEDQTKKDALPYIPEDQLKMPEEPFLETEPTKSTFNIAPVLIVVIIILALILGGLLAWSVYGTPQASVEAPVTATRPSVEENNEPESTTAEAVVQTLDTVSTSDEIFAIEADLQSTNIESLDSELRSIETELGL